MSRTSPDREAVATRPDHRLARRVAAGLRLAAAPTFLVMALMSVGRAGDVMGPLCGAHSVMPGMAVMYGLMSLFHAGPWLRWIGRVRRPAVAVAGCRSTGSP